MKPHVDLARPSRTRRVGEAVGFVAVWMWLGYWLRLSSEAYLLLGIPLTLGFQALVRRRSLSELWVRRVAGSEKPCGFTRRRLLVTAALLVAPVYWGIRASTEAGWVVVGWYVAAAAGAFAAAFALSATSLMAVLRTAALATAIGVLGNVVVLGSVLVVTEGALDPTQAILRTMKWLALYFPATFVIEEVAFRGALDSHIHHGDEGRDLASALVVSALWGLWHLPVSSGMPWPLLLASLLGWHCLVGVPLSFAWRRSDNLSGPAFAHAAIDAVRNALSGL